MSAASIVALIVGAALVISLGVIIFEGVAASFTRAHNTIATARTDDLDPVEEHPRLIDLDTGTEYEWVDDVDNPDNSGYANASDHDVAWPRDVLERVVPLVELRSLDPSQIELLRRQLDQ